MTTTTKPANPPTDKEKTCKKFSVSVLINTSDEKQQITFGLTHGCNPDKTDYWMIDFILKVKKGSELKTRVEVHVVIGSNQEADKAKADALAEEIKKNKKLDDDQVDLLQTKVTDRSLQIPQSKAQTDPELTRLLKKVL